MLDDDENGVARLTHAFGVNANVQDAVICTDEVGVLLPVGRMISLFSWESRAMSFVSEGERGDLALALALAPSKKHVAVCERGEHAQVSLYHVASQRRQKTLSCSDVASRDYVSAAFSPDSKLLAALSGAPDYTLVLWLWDKGKVLATVKLGQPAARVSFSPNDAKTVATSGTRLLRLWRVAEGAFKPFNLSMGKHKNELHAWNDHTWLADDKLVAVTEASAQLGAQFGAQFLTGAQLSRRAILLRPKLPLRRAIL